MTREELEEAIADANDAWHGPNGNPLMNPNMPTEVATYRATLEVAYQLCLLREQLPDFQFRAKTGALIVENVE